MPLIVPANEQGAGFMAAGYARASGRVGVVLVTSGPGATNTVTPVRDCMADSIPIVVICGQVPTGDDRHRRVPGSAGLGDHGLGGQARVPGHRSVQARGDDAHGVRDRAHRPPGPGRRRPAEGRAELDRRVPGHRPAARARLSPAHRGRAGQRAHRERLQVILRPAARVEAAADLCRRRRHQRQRGRGAAQVRAALRDPGDHHADGHRRLRHHGAAVAAHARHARRRVRQLRGGGLRLPDRRRRALRRSRGRRAGEVRAQGATHRCTSTSTPPRSARSRRWTGTTSACSTGTSRRCVAYGERHHQAPDSVGVAPGTRRAQAPVRLQLRSRQRS